MNFSIDSIDHVQLAAPNGCEVEAREFYSNLLGLQEIEKPQALKKKGGVWFSLGTTQIHIGVEEPFIPAKKAHPAFKMYNLAAFQAFLKENDVPFTIDLEIPDVKRIFIYDPFGNRVEILEKK
ncbi:VOC family protein [Caldibacillus lycopersici]|uniref:VOC family protein n=1 Tax=Perspicuibacillus lycopersici TaxID=1325689 RepID=A0AAE3IWJ3_9BACI|nr:VOC family protein [Perspicuibacillus lycopersici]MCU9614704.1 VOC family protein [Perspicuibacillus lycopersici]